MSLNKNTTLEELYSTCDMTLLKESINEYVERQHFMALNMLFRRNQNERRYTSRLMALKRTIVNGVSVTMLLNI